MGRRRNLSRALVVLGVSIGLLAIPAPSGAATVIYERPPVVAWQTNGTVYAVQIVGDTVYVGGSFTEVRSRGRAEVAARANLAAFDVHTGVLIEEFSADTNGPVRKIRAAGAALLVAGRFTTVAGLARSRVAMVDPTSGAVATWAPPAIDGPVYDARLVGARVVIGGDFNTVGGTPRGSLAALSASSGALDTDWVADTDGYVRALQVSPDSSTVYVAGRFRTVAGTDHRHLVAVAARGGAVLPYFFSAPREFLWDLEISSDGRSLYGGCRCNRIVAWKATGGRKLYTGVLLGGDAQAVTYRAGTVYFGFHEGAFGDPSLRLLAADAATGAVDASFRPAIDTFFGVLALDSSADALVAGGTFKNVDGVAAQGFAIFPAMIAPDTTRPTAPTSVSMAAGPRLSWTAATDDVAVEGYIVRRNGVRVGFVNGTSWTDTAPLPAKDVTYTVMAVDPAGNRSAASAPLRASFSNAVLASSFWRYNASGRDLGTAWRETSYRVRSWPVGRAALGFGSPAIETALPASGRNGLARTTTYFRRSFTVTNPATIAGVTLAVRRDDGAAVYVNGVEVARTNLPEGPLSASTLAMRSVKARTAAGQTAEYLVSPSLLVAGTNVIAVEVHQARPGDPDLIFSASLRTHRLS